MDTNGEARDTFNDGCDWYTNEKGDSAQSPSACGIFDDTDFEAGKMCCACGGGQLACHDDPEARDFIGGGCDWY